MIIGILFFFYAGYVLRTTHGHYHSGITYYTFFFMATALALLLRPWMKERFSHLYSYDRIFLFILGSIQAVFIYWLGENLNLIYIDPTATTLLQMSHDALNGALAISVTLSLFFLSKNTLSGRYWKIYQLGSLFVLGLLFFVEVSVPLISPKPFIDVFVSNTAATDFFLGGHNPYTQVYLDIYQGEYSYTAGFLYFPGLLYCLAPFRWILGDIRYALVAANFLSMMGLYLLCKMLGAPKPMRWLIPGIFAAFPVTFFVIEQSWTDPVLLCVAIFICLCVEKNWWVAAGILIGFVFSVKQYAVFISFFGLLRVWQIGGRQKILKVFFYAAGTFLMITLPFILADWNAFYSMTIGNHLGAEVRPDAFNFTVYLYNEFGYYLPSWLQLLITLMGVSIGIFTLFSRRTDRAGEYGVALFISYGFSFLFGKWAFCNYHYLFVSFLLIALSGGWPKRILIPQKSH